VVVNATRSFEARSPVSRYWLARCEGFTVRNRRRVLGAVAEIGAADPLGTAEYLVVRRRPALRRRRALIPAEQVTEVIPARRTLVVDDAPSQATARTRQLARAGRAAAPLAASLGRATLALLRVLLRLTTLFLALAGRLALLLGAGLRRRLPPALAAARRGLALTLLALAWLARAAVTEARALWVRARPALAELRARRAAE
jgi:hypothetical protein